MSDDITGNETPEEIQRIIDEVCEIARQIEEEDRANGVTFDDIDPADTEWEDDVFPEWDAAAEQADDARRGK